MVKKLVLFYKIIIIKMKFFGIYLVLLYRGLRLYFKVLVKYGNV